MLKKARKPFYLVQHPNKSSQGTGGHTWEGVFYSLLSDIHRGDISTDFNFFEATRKSTHSPQNFGEKQRICRQHQAGRDEVNCVSPAVEAPPSSPQPSRPGRCRGGAAVRRAREHGSRLQLAGQRHEDRGVACWASHVCIPRLSALYSALANKAQAQARLGLSPESESRMAGKWVGSPTPAFRVVEEYPGLNSKVAGENRSAFSQCAFPWLNLCKSSCWCR